MHWLIFCCLRHLARIHLGNSFFYELRYVVSILQFQVIAYLMKENRWTVEEAIYYVKECRSCIRPNNGFMLQLKTYEGILNARFEKIGFFFFFHQPLVKVRSTCETPCLCPSCQCRKHLVCALPVNVGNTLFVPLLSR